MVTSKSSYAFAPPAPLTHAKAPVVTHCNRRPRHNHAIHASAIEGPSPRRSALDSLPEALKLNAVADSLARQGDLEGTLAVLRSIDEGGEGDVRLSPAALSSVVNLLASEALPPTELASHLCRALRLCASPGFGVASSRTLSAPAPLPDGSRGARVFSAAAFLGTLGVAAAAEVLEPAFAHHAANDAHAVLLALCAAFLYDRYARAARGWAYVADGLSRVLSDDPKRAARVEAAHFLVAYLLGLPWVCQAPDERAVAAVMKDATTGFRADDEEAIDGVLVWLLAGAAAETAIDGALIESDTASAYRLLRLVRDGARGKKSRDQERVAAAYATAAELVEEHAAVLDALSARMLRRESAGECVAFLGEAFDQASQQAQIHKA